MVSWSNQSSELPTVLLVDDRIENLLAFEVALRQLRCEIVKADSGEKALDYLKTSAPALILLDVQMPGMDGFEVAKEIRDLFGDESPPILFITAIDPDAQYISRAYACGGADFITKPVEPLVLISKAKVFLDLHDVRTRLAEQARRESDSKREEVESKYRDLVESMDHAIIWSAEPEKLQFTFVSPRTEFVTGYSLSEWMNESDFFFNHVPVEDHGKLKNLISRVELGADEGVEHRFVHKTGKILWLHTGMRRAKMGTAGIFEIRGLSSDVTNIMEARAQYRSLAEELAKLNESLKQAKEEAEKANELKSAFLANMSHEIRTPLGAMIGFADLLRDPNLTSSQKENYIDILARNGESLSVIINDILDLSKVEAGHLNLEFADTYPEQIADDVVSLLKVKTQEKGLALDLIIDATAPRTIIADATRVRQILLNLLGNAIKFTQFGGITVRCFGCKVEDGRKAVCFEISDTGIGIPESQVEDVFEMFVQADGSMTRRFGGTGLGLALSRSLARSLGGNVTVTKTSPGKGTTFLVTIADHQELRINKGSLAKRENRQHVLLKPLQGARVLIVDDSPDNRQLIWHYLNREKAIVDTAENGLIGVRMALSGDYDVILMDIQMPVLDGFAATGKLRSAGYRKPIIALTAHAMNEVRDRVLGLGATAHLPKPINPNQLISTIADLLP